MSTDVIIEPLLRLVPKTDQKAALQL